VKKLVTILQSNIDRHILIGHTVCTAAFSLQNKIVICHGFCL